MSFYKLIITATCIFLSVVGYSQSNMADFKTLLTAKDTSAQFTYLQKWEKESSKDPDLYVAYFNYYVNLARQEVIELGYNPDVSKDVLVLKDSADNDAGYIYSNTLYNPYTAAKGLSKINAGIKIAPQRLDMRYGKIYVLGEMKNYDEFTKEIIETITYGAKINYNFTWSDNKTLPDGKARVMDGIQTYFAQLYNTEDEKQLSNMKAIAETVLKYEPESVTALSNLAVIFMITQDYDKALETLLKATKINPKDAIVLSNIATAYRNNGDNKNAIKYYELTIKYGNKEEIEFAEKRITELKTK